MNLALKRKPWVHLNSLVPFPKTSPESIEEKQGNSHFYPPPLKQPFKGKTEKSPKHRNQCRDVN